jgi:hypothetical protein
MEVFHKGEQGAVLCGLDSFVRSVEHYASHGVTFPDLSKVKLDFEVAVNKFIDENPMSSWQLKGIEYPLPDYGNCRLDIVGIDPEGYWAIADFKYKRQLKLDYLTKTITDYKDSWQFQHYPWAWNDMVSKGGTEYEPVQRIWLYLVVASPFKILKYPFFVKESLQKMWLQSAQQKWADIRAIETGDRQAVMSAVHRDQYGECPFKRACLEFNFDPGLIEYTKVPKQ